MKDNKLYPPTINGVEMCILDMIKEDAKEAGVSVYSVLKTVTVDGWNGIVSWELPE